MILQLKYFGILAEAIGKTEEVLELDSNTVFDLDIILKNRYSELEAINYKYAVDQNLVDNEFELSNNNEVALLPPFAGG